MATQAPVSPPGLDPLASHARYQAPGEFKPIHEMMKERGADFVLVVKQSAQPTVVSQKPMTPNSNYQSVKGRCETTFHRHQIPDEKPTDNQHSSVCAVSGAAIALHPSVFVALDSASHATAIEALADIVTNVRRKPRNVADKA